MLTDFVNMEHMKNAIVVVLVVTFNFEPIFCFVSSSNFFLNGPFLLREKKYSD